MFGRVLRSEPEEFDDCAVWAFRRDRCRGAFWSFWTIGPTQVGLVRKRFGRRALEQGNPLAFRGEAGYQAKLLMPGLRFKLWPLFAVTRHPMVQIPAGQIGVVISQVGMPSPIGAKSGIYRPEFGNFQDLAAFVTLGGQKGVQRPVLPPGTVAPIHPVAFLVITAARVYGIPIAPEFAQLADGRHQLSVESFGLKTNQLHVLRIEPTAEKDGRIIDMIGIVTTLEGPPLRKGAIANRIGDFDDVAQLEAMEQTRDSESF
jgi:hypothetical protein